MVAAEQPMVGPAGTMAVFDGARLLHRGGMVREGERVALQIVFGPAPPRWRTTASHAKLAVEDAVSRRAELRPRLGRLVQRFSPAPKARLERAIAALLPELACIDVGASYYPHPAWDLFRWSRRTRWIAVEPNAQNTAYLDTWPWPSRPTRVGRGLSEHGGTQILHVTNIDSGSSLLPPVINSDMEHRVTDRDYFFPVTERSIETLTLDQVIHEHAGALPAFVKLDTQGTELAILRGASTAFMSNQIVGIEAEATLLAKPVMVGAGKLWDMAQFLESNGFELLQLKPIEGGGSRASQLPRRTYLNECDAVFGLTRSALLARPVEHRIAALGFYAAYGLYDEARTLLDHIPNIDTRELRELLGS
ncbi:MAG: FkbM family methyltransferase [Kofleriaceae bacterium]